MGRLRATVDFNTTQEGERTDHCGIHDLRRGKQGGRTCLHKLMGTPWMLPEEMGTNAATLAAKVVVLLGGVVARVEVLALTRVSLRR